MDGKAKHIYSKRNLQNSTKLLLLIVVSPFVGRTQVKPCEELVHLSATFWPPVVGVRETLTGYFVPGHVGHGAWIT